MSPRNLPAEQPPPEQSLPTAPGDLDLQRLIELSDSLRQRSADLQRAASRLSEDVRPLLHGQHRRKATR